MEHVQTLLHTGEANEIFLTSDCTDSELFMQAMRIGVKEFFSQPISEDEVRQSLERFKKRHQEPAMQPARKKGRIITVFGSKGGVGTTTVAVNIAVSLVQNNADCSVTLLDMNTLFGEIPLFLEMSPKFTGGKLPRTLSGWTTPFCKHPCQAPKRSSGFAFSGIFERACPADT